MSGDDQGGQKAQPMPRRSFLKTAALTGVGLSVGGVGVGLGLLAVPGVQRKLLYHPDTDIEGNPLPPMEPPAHYGLKGMVSQTLRTQQGESFVIWRSENLRPDQKTLVLFPGNFGHLGHSPAKGPAGEDLGGGTTAYIDVIREAQKRGYQVVAANHVGFAGSDVSPSQEGMQHGAGRLVDWLVDEVRLQPNDLNFLGVSMGGALAAHAARHLSERGCFMYAPQQKLRLVMANSLLDMQDGVAEAFKDVPLLPRYTDAALKERLNVDESLGWLGTAYAAHERVYVSYLRGQNDTLTPQEQVAKHLTAAQWLNVDVHEVDGGHFIAPSRLMDEVDRVKQRSLVPSSGVRPANGR